MASYLHLMLPGIVVSTDSARGRVRKKSCDDGATARGIGQDQVAAEQGKSSSRHYALFTKRI
jgi:hypothetical protein